MTDYSRPVRRPRRRRWQRDPRVVVAGVATAALGLFVLGGNVYGGFNVGQPQHVRVSAGDTLWTIASTHYQSGDVRDHVDQMISLNHLDGGAITPGEVLLLPAP
ncbi:MAG TPA: LysM peptidoglycan-binding domain-containing protein [Candidatus Dormibacteraeota bacterium]|nr:LysM peptidoglycan-binding domain-containing protein [Candidatus Dormibacteraeota bacterium]